MTLALDTNVLVEVVRGRRAVVMQRFRDALAAEEPLVASLIVLHELHLGCALHHDPAAELARVQAALSEVEVEPLNERDVVTAASLRAVLLRQGRPVGALDGLIAGQALARGWTMVTANVGEFGRVAGLNVVDWTVAAD